MLITVYDPVRGREKYVLDEMEDIMILLKYLVRHEIPFDVKPT